MICDSGRCIVVYRTENFFLMYIVCWTCFTINFYQSRNVNIKSSGVFEVTRGDHVSRNKRYTFKTTTYTQKAKLCVFTLFMTVRYVAATEWFFTKIKRFQS